MPLCGFCASFSLSDDVGEKIRLPNYSQLQKNATDGCDGCRSFRDLLEVTLPSGSVLDPDVSAFLQVKHAPPSAFGDIWYDTPNSTPNRIQLVHSPEPSFAGRPKDVFIPQYPTADHCLQQVRLWLDGCLAHGCARRENVVLPKRVIEVPSDKKKQPTLRITRGEAGTYVALTHCWGRKPMKKLLADNETEWSNGIDPSSLSQNFQDALEITRLLGYRYIWIDALCIVQDSAKDWEEQAPKMAEVYSCANLVLSAAFATNSDEGFLRYRPSLVTPRLGPESAYFVSEAFLDNEYQFRRIIDMCPLNSRSWCAQERIMATRILHYTPYGMLWECSQSFLTESPKPEVRINDLYRSNSVGSLDKREYDILGHIERWLQRRIKTPVGIADENLLNTALRAWFHCVTEYSGRDLTHATDKLPAIAALADVFSNGLGDYLGGIWSNFPSRCLSWQATGVSRKIPTEYRAPSWSWASIDCRIQWPCDLQAKHITTSWSDRHGPRLLEHKMAPGLVPNPYMSVGLGSYLVLEGECVDARSTPLEVTNPVHYTGGWDDLSIKSNSSWVWPSIEQIPEELILLRLQERMSDPAQNAGRERLQIFVISLRAVDGGAQDHGPSTFRRVGSGTLYIEPGKDSSISVEELAGSVQWKQRRLKLI
ncbi:heterokaryon incompatibility protein-domain-containing protein [Nemania abortiva]|nr:heterokaryon incompatibility protein-domain-containing protein [Nemania abortiva]